MYGLAALVIGIAMLFISQSIYRQVLEGKEKIFQAQQRVDQGNSLFSLNPYAHELGKEITGSAQNQINEGQKKVQFYEQVASMTYVGGIIVIVIGLGVIVLSFIQKHKK